jgi:hypothetical protein
MSQRIWQNAHRTLLLVVVVILTVSLSDCARKRSGVYVTKDGRSTPYMELKSDGTFYVQSVPGKSSSGTYEVEGNTLTIKDQTGVTAKGAFQNDGSLLIGGFTFVRK